MDGFGHVLRRDFALNGGRGGFLGFFLGNRFLHQNGYGIGLSDVHALRFDLLWFEIIGNTERILVKRTQGIGTLKRYGFFAPVGPLSVLNEPCTLSLIVIDISRQSDKDMRGFKLGHGREPFRLVVLIDYDKPMSG